MGSNGVADDSGELKAVTQAGTVSCRPSLVRTSVRSRDLPSPASPPTTTT